MGLGEEIFNLNTGNPEIKALDSERMLNVIKRMNGDVFKSITALTGFALQKIKQDKIKRGLLDKNGKSKINLDDFFHEVKQGNKKSDK